MAYRQLEVGDHVRYVNVGHPAHGKNVVISMSGDSSNPDLVSFVYDNSVYVVLDRHCMVRHEPWRGVFDGKLVEDALEGFANRFQTIPDDEPDEEDFDDEPCFECTCCRHFMNNH